MQCNKQISSIFYIFYKDAHKQGQLLVYIL